MVKKTSIFINIILGGIIIVLLFLFFLEKTKIEKKLEKNYAFLNPVVTSEMKKHFIINFQPLRTTLEEIQKKYNEKTFIYFLYLNNGAWLGLRERDFFTTASLIKVPLSMAIYKAIEDGKLDENIKYNLDVVDLDKNFGDLYKMQGNTLTVKDLVSIMLKNSDNTAANALFKIFLMIGIDNPLESIYHSMGWEFDSKGEKINYGLIHAKIFSNMFLSLYNATYINPEHSQMILSYLTQTPFDQQMVQGVPENISVAHKLGIYEPDKTLSDCGIVYAPHREYVLCLASSGMEQVKADRFMKEISKAIYDFVIKN